MYFQVAISPVDPVKKQQSVAPLEDVAVLKLAPFAPRAKIFFENVTVGEVETKKLIIQNPNAYKTQLKITKLLPADRHFTLSWIEAEIAANEEITLELTWAPKEEGSWREVLSILDNRNTNRDVPITFKSILKKGKRRVLTKQTGKPKPATLPVTTVKKFRSPKNTKKKRSPLKVSDETCVPKTYRCENCHNNVHITTCSPLKKRSNIFECNKENSPVMFQQKLENISPITYQQKPDNSFNKMSFSEKINRMDNSSFFLSPTNVNFKCDNILQTPIRRETYAITRQPVLNNFIDSPDSLELERKIDSLELTQDLSVRNISQSSDSFVRKLNMDATIDLPVANKPNDDYLVQKLLSDSFAFNTSTVNKKTSHFQIILNETEVLNEIFYPTNCSTETKTVSNCNKNNSSTPKELFKPNSTYELSPGSRKNNSPHNLSAGTYTMSNISSSSTYALLSPDETHNRIKELTDHEKSVNYAKINTSSPVLANTTTNQFHATSNYLNFSGINAKSALSCITEEDLFSDASIRNASIRSDISNVGLKRKSEQPEMIFTVSPPKRAFIKPKSPKSLKHTNSTWSKKLEKTEKIRRKSISSLKLNLSKNSSKANISDVSTSSVNITQTTCNIDPFLIAAMYNSNTSTVNSNLDPFISSTLYYDEAWLEKQIKELKKWLNALLTPPSELAAKAESRKVDVAKLWQDCVKKDLIYAPTKEKVSSKYHTNHKLDILRKSAKNLFHSQEIRNVLSKVAIIIEKKQISIREDKNLHLDVGLQSQILTLLLCYNPLWLRIGLETIYNEEIPLESNSDVIGLSTFIMLKFFRCPDLMPKNKQGSHIKYLPAYAVTVKKFTLKKFLMLIYFLDQAKTKKLISHDPCLFCRDAPVKESKELLLSFSRELLSAVGDITKFMRRLGYEVSHKQSFIDEFDYAVKNLGVDLRDGIRLTKVMEIILLRNDLTNQLRGPAISRLQKIHNVKLALDGLLQAGYTIAGEITAKDIVDGHREKTLSLLWQIIYKFQAPRFTKAASQIQIWWRSLNMVIKRRILDRPRQLKINSAIKIQQFYRSWKLMQKERSKFLEITKSVITIQRFTRSIFLKKRDRLQYLLKKQAVVMIQQKYRATKLMQEQRSRYLTMKNSAIVIQRQFRARSAMKKTQEQYLKLKEVVIKIQRNFRSKKIVKEQRNNFLQKRSAAIVIQRHFKATLQMKVDRNIYLRTKNVIIKVQQRFRATLLMRQIRSTYLEQRKSIVFLQQKYRANILMKETRKSYLEHREAVVTVQQRFRANVAMKQTREKYLLQRKAATTIQRNFKAYLAKKNCRENYLILLQKTIYIQQKFKANMAMKITRKNYLQQRNAAILIQQKFRAYLEMKECRNNYLELKRVATYIQQIYRANIAMKEARNKFIELKKSTVLIQQRFRANILMKNTRETYLKDRKAIIRIQQKYKAKLAMKRENNNYLLLKNSVIIVQRRFRANLLMKQQQESYLKLKQSVIITQRIFRANVAMKIDQENYLKQRQIIIKMQQVFRATQAMKLTRENYLRDRNIIIKLQQRIRANSAMKNQRKYYITLRNATVNIQRRYRANKIMKMQQQSYLQQKHAATVIQEQFRAYLEMKKCRHYYLELKRSAIVIQTTFKSKLEMDKCRQNYIKLRESVILVQRKFRAQLAMKKAHENYVQLRKAAINIQQRFRANISMKKDRQIYLEKRRKVILLQHKFRATLAMRKDRENYVQYRKAVINVQQRFRANISMKKDRHTYLEKRRNIILLQQKLRATLAMRKNRENYVQYRKAVMNVQQRFRANIAMKKDLQIYLEKRRNIILLQQKLRATLAMRKDRENYVQYRKAVINVQQRFRANIAMKKDLQIYLEKRRNIILLQQKLRATLAMRKDRENYVQYRKAVINVQQRFRANIAMNKDRQTYLEKRRNIILLQQKLRATLAMRKDRENYVQYRKAVINVQQRFRANIAMKKDRQTYLEKRRNIILLQQKFRATLAMRKDRENYVQYRKAVINVQQRFRVNISMKKDRHIYLEKRRKIIWLQQKLRATLAMRKDRENYLKTRKAVITLQQHFRANVAMKNERVKYLQIKKTVLFLQERFRANVSMKKVRESYLHTKQSVVIIQQRFKAYLAMKTIREHYILLRNATIVIQRRFRANLAMKQGRQIFIERKLSAINIQRWFRNVIVTKTYRNQYLLQKKSVSIIQQRFREYILMKKQRTAYLEMKKSTIVIQNHFRSYLLTKKYRTDFLHTMKSIRTIQTYYRSYLMMKKCRNEFLQKKDAVIIIQRYFRAFLKKCSIQKMQLQIKAVVKIQCWVRIHAAKKQLARLRENSKEIEERKLQRKLHKSAAKIQALWRGYKTRKIMGKKMAMIRQRSVEAANNALPEYAIGQRNKEAINLLIHQMSMKEIIHALTILDFTTRLFPNLCIEVCDEITERLYILLVCTNRSVPDMEASVLCVSVLINLYKYQPTSSAVWKVRYVERLLSLLLQCSDKDGVLFPHLCTLVWLFAQKPEYCQVILAEKNAAKILAKSYQHCERKQKMITRMRNIPTKTPAKKQKDVVPALAPDWGISRLDRPRVFGNPLFAIKCLLQKMNVTLNI